MPARNRYSFKGLAIPTDRNAQRNMGLEANRSARAYPIG
jgi:hypothetical protein